MKRILTLGIVLLTVNSLLPAQEITFSETKFNWGTVREQDGNVSHDFRFVNTGDKPLTIKNIIFVLRNIGWALASLSVGGIIAGGIGRGLTFYLSRHFQGNYSFGSSVSIYFGYEVDVVFCSALRVVDQPYYAFLTGLIGFFSPFVRGASAKEHWITGIAQPCSETCRPLMPNMPANMQTLLAVSSPRKHRISVRTRIQCIIAQIICYTTGKITTFPCAPLQHAPTRPKAVTVKIYTGPI